MSDCCSSKSCEIEALASVEAQRRVLIVVLVLNAVMFVAEFCAGLVAGSTALMADSIDMAGDASVYALSLYALGRSDRWKAGAALIKGGFILLFGMVIFGEAAVRASEGTPPAGDLMLSFGLLALAVNLTCFVLLWRFRRGDVNMSSSFECSRNDLIANGGVVLAAFAVLATNSIWPDIIIGLLIAAIFLRSAFRVLVEAWPMWRGKPTTE